MYSHETERAVLAAIANISQLDLNEARGLIARYGLGPDLFHLPAHESLYKASQGLLNEGLPVEPVAVISKLKGSPDVEAAGGKTWLAGILSDFSQVPTALPGYVKELKDLALRRRMVKELQTGLAKVSDNQIQPEIALVEVSNALASLTKTTKDYRRLSSFGPEVLGDIEAAKNGERLAVIPTGIRELDNVIGGWQRGMLNIVGGQTGGGKSALFATTVQAVAKSGVKVGVFSLEDQGSWLVWRHLSKDSGIDQQKLRIAAERLTKQEYARVVEAVEDMKSYADNVLVDDRPGLTAEQIVATMTDWVVNHGVELVFVDHAGELNYGKDTDRLDMRIAHALSLFRDVAKAHSIAVVVGTQVTMPRDVKPGTPPESKHMKNSSEIANKARLILGIGRDPGQDIMQIRICKNTNGPAGEILEIPFHKSAAMLFTEDGGMFDA